ncbi:GHKL domain-containing protein [Hanamia caeni]|jgi:signal transduction histidine kinase|uniref:histidine kinase n=2 Tax=Hanamia caeni TaxID=2294116 RepID=A0A3M9NEF7_9BACT|nr:GHKL domain-containing protein [Hanamia caeni]
MAGTMQRWNKIFWWLIYAAIALLVIHFSYGGSDAVTQWLSIILLSVVIYIIYKNDEFKRASFFVTASVPYILVSLLVYFIKAIDPSLYTNWETWLEAATSFSVIWGFGTWLTNRRQRNELAKAREKAINEEKNNRIMAEMKSQLEVQVAQRTSELTKQKEELEHALIELKSTQSQLIQAEKMASLGELTAGIAHEIQNPLNFVNNFSEVNNELIGELKSEWLKPEQERDKTLEQELLDDISQNLDKINYHGKRADAIVKGMLQHSRISTGQKDPTDINALADEYLRLSYHGLRAKNKNFNATIKTDFDTTIGEINIVAQDVGRVLLNLINNAFYAVNEKFRGLKDGSSYEPTVSVSTRKIDQSVEIIVEDNGDGMPSELRDKIFQPFFTTKPTGEGTGLGLSISYDIIKAHGGEIRVESSQGNGSKFVITLPIK